MKRIKQFFRLLYIHHVAAKNGLDQVLFSFPLFAPLRILGYLNPWNWVRKKNLTRGQALRLTLEELGPLFIKLGQALSTRPDILPEDIALELNKLQDKVPPFSSDLAIEIIKECYGRELSEIFTCIEPTPLASASMAQVHAATLITGEEVVIKLLRPHMRPLIQRDISLMYAIAGLVERYWQDGKRLKPIEIVKEFEYTTLNELDLLREAANATQLRRNFANSPLLHVPLVYWDYTRENIMVMERIHGIPITELSTLQDYGVNVKKLAERGVEIFFTQVFRDCFFHADMHPGNIFVSYVNPKDPQYLCVDFGIMGTLRDDDKRYLAENLYAFFSRDYRRVAELHVESGWVNPNTRVDEFESAIRTVCEPIFEKPLKDISFSQLIIQLFKVANRFDMVVQPQLVLLQKTLLAVEGLGRQLYPELDLWVTAKPFLEDWLREQVGPKSLVRLLKQNLPFFVEQLPLLPKLVYDLVSLKKEQLAVLQYEKSHQPTPQKARIWPGFLLGLLVSALGIAIAIHLKVGPWF